MAVSLVGWFMNPGQFFQSYLTAYMLVLGVIGPLIALGIWLVVEKTRWGRIVRAARRRYRAILRGTTDRR